MKSAFCSTALFQVQQSLKMKSYENKIEDWIKKKYTSAKNLTQMNVFCLNIEKVRLAL